MIWDKSEQYWNQMYDIAKMYYEQYGNLDVLQACRVVVENGKVNIIKKEDSRYKDAIRLGEWLNTQRQAKKGHGTYGWDNEREEKLNQIGVIWEPKEHKFITKTITTSNSDKIKKELDRRLDDLLEQMKDDKQTLENGNDVKDINDAFADSLGKKR